MKALFNQYIAWLCGLGILGLSIIPSASIPEIDVSYLDKIVHFAMYAILAGIWFGYLVREDKSSPKKLMVTVFLLASGYGLLMEILQLIFFESRSFEIYDIISNIIGSLTGVIFVNNFFNSKK